MSEFVVVVSECACERESTVSKCVLVVSECV